MKVTVEGGQLPDEPGPFRVEEAAPGAPVRVTVTWPVGDTAVSSSAWFITGADGRVDPRRQPSYAGSYTGIDPFGLFWTARAADGSVPRPSGSSADVDVEVAAVSSGGEAVGHFRRFTRSPDVDDVSVRSLGLVGRFLHFAGGPRPGVLVLGGSDGGLGTATRIAGLLSSRGLNVLALAYFGLPGLPRDLREVPVEYVQTALRWLAAHSAVDGDTPAVLGVSRGAELALLAASTYPDLVGAVAAIAPSVHLWSALDIGQSPAAAWTHHGRPLPFVPDQSAAASAAIETMLAGSGTDPGAAYMETAIATASPEDRIAARIPLDRITSPVLLATGAADALWPSAQHCQDAVDQLEPGHLWEHISYRGAGHRISLFPTAPITTVIPDVGDGTRLEFGGTDQATAAAAADLWTRLPRWLDHPPQQRNPRAVSGDKAAEATGARPE